MSILEIENLRFSYTDNNLFNNANLKIFEGEHVGLVGKNGSGKSTLMKLIASKLTQDSGEIVLDKTKTYSYLDQDLEVEFDTGIYEYLYNVYTPLFLKEQEMDKIYSSLNGEINLDVVEKKLKQAQAIQDYLDEKNFYQIKSRISNVINGLGIDVSEDRSLKELSGGQRAKVFLGHMLLEEKDVLLLDEPTNFLDASHVEWLSKLLTNYKNAFIVISHNTDFLNRVCNVIVNLENKTLTKYKGNYDSFISQKKLSDEAYLKEYERQQKEIKRQEDFIQKNIVRASTTKRAQSRRKMLEKMERLEKPETEKKITFHFPFTKSFTVDAVKTNNLAIGYNNKKVLDNINLKIRFGHKYIILGANGVGKTTLIKTILSLIPKISGSFSLAPYNDILYYSQEEERKDITPIDYIREKYPKMDNTSVGNLLASFGITQGKMIESCLDLSGGEFARVRLARLIKDSSNLLILDEPTMHLDKNGKAALYQAIKEYPGTVILVSHEMNYFDELDMIKIRF